jgi:hypothetical protein
VEQVLCLLFSVVMIAVVIAALGYHSQRVAQLNNAFSQAAQAFGGSLQPGGLFGRPSIHFSHRGARGELDVYSTGGQHATHYTRVRIRWADARLRCEICPERFLNQLGKFLGMQDIQIGSPGFDRDYFITGNDPAAIRTMLTAEAQATIGEIRRFRGNDDIYVGVRGGMLEVRKRELLREAWAIQQFVKMSVELYDRAMLGMCAGVEIVGETAAPDAGDAVCQVCGELIQNDPVVCRSCKTPHHQDCWEYFGACSTYGCGDTVYRRLRSRAPAPLKGRSR